MLRKANRLKKNLHQLWNVWQKISSRGEMLECAGAHLNPKCTRPDDTSDTILIPKHQKQIKTPHRPTPSPHQKRTTQHTNVVTAPTLPSSVSMTICQI